MRFRSIGTLIYHSDWEAYLPILDFGQLNLEKRCFGVEQKVPGRRFGW